MIDVYLIDPLDHTSDWLFSMSRPLSHVVESFKNDSYRPVRRGAFYLFVDKESSDARVFYGDDILDDLDTLLDCEDDLW